MEPRERARVTKAPVDFPPRLDRAAQDGMAERAQCLLEILERRGKQRIAASRMPHRDRTDRTALRARQGREALRPARVEAQLVLGLAREAPRRRGFVVGEPRVRDVGDRPCLFARAQAEVDVLEAIDERLVKPAVIEKPLRAHGHRGARDGKRGARRANAVERRRKIAAVIVPVRVAQQHEARGLRSAVLEEQRAAGDCHVGPLERGQQRRQRVG